MKIFNITLVILIALVSIVAGSAKVMQIPQEVEFLTALGFTITLILFFGMIQITGGILLLIPKIRLLGAAVVLTGFMISAGLVFMSGNIKFGLISLVPVLITVFILYREWNSKKDDI